MTTAHFGSISSGTMRNEDLLSAFADELHILGRKDAAEYSDLKVSDEAFQRWLKAQSARDRLIGQAAVIDPDSEAAGEIVQDLAAALEEYAPAYGYFGSHPGDGADYGFWLSENFADDFDGLKVSDTSEVPADYAGEVLHVNDHGNMTLYAKDEGKEELREIWAIV